MHVIQSIIKNQYFQIGKIALLTGASTHLIILYLYVFATGNFRLVNIFEIIGIGLLNPKLTEGPVSFVLSYLTFGLLYLVVMYIYKRNRKKS